MFLPPSDKNTPRGPELDLDGSRTSWLRVAGQVYGVEVPSCGGNDVLAKIDAELVPHRVTVAGAPVAGAITGHTADAFYYISTTGCTFTGGTLYRYTPADGRVVPLLGGPQAGGGVVRGVYTVVSPAVGGMRPPF